MNGIDTEQQRLAALVSIRQRYPHVVDGCALLCAAIVGPWSAERLEMELRVAAGELLDDLGGAELRREGPPVCFAGEAGASDTAPGRLFTRAP